MTSSTSTNASSTENPASAQAIENQISQETNQATTNANESDIESRDGGSLNPRIAAAQMHSVQQQTDVGVGKGFQFTPDQIETQLTKTATMINDLKVDLVAARQAAAGIYAPAPDPASVMQTTAAKKMLADTVSVIQSHITYLDAWQTSLTQAKTNYLATEHVTETQWQRLAQGLDT